MHHFIFQTITAEDNGGKSNSATVNIKVEDVNDQSPEFDSVPYSFRVSEGDPNAIVGKFTSKIHAVLMNKQHLYNQQCSNFCQI